MKSRILTTAACAGAFFALACNNNPSAPEATPVVGQCQGLGGQPVTGGMMGSGGMGPGMMGAGWQAADGTYGMVFTFTTA